MSDSESLYRAILAAPADDAPRLVYADWLEEHGDMERAELIRHMVHFPRDRARYRPPNPASIYWPDAPPWIGYGVRRGFVADVELNTPLFLAHAAELFARHPIGLVVLLDRHTSRAQPRPMVSAIVTTTRLDVSHHWPSELFPEALDRAELVFKSSEAAPRSLSARAVAFGRKAAGLPPLESV